MFRVIEAFADRADNLHIYQPGDIYPRAGFVPDDKRVSELAGRGNAIGHALVEAVEPPKQAVDDKPNGTIKRTSRTAKKAVPAPDRGRHA